MKIANESTNTIIDLLVKPSTVLINNPDIDLEFIMIFKLVEVGSLIRELYTSAIILAENGRFQSENSGGAHPDKKNKIVSNTIGIISTNSLDRFSHFSSDAY